MKLLLLVALLWSGFVYVAAGAETSTEADAATEKKAQTKAQTPKPKLGFIAQLDAQADREYQELIESIQTMNNAEYAALLNQRIENAYAGGAQDLPVRVSVDVSAEMNQPQPGWFARLFSTHVKETEHGRRKAQGLLKTGPGKSASTFTYRGSYKGDDKQHFQHIEAQLDQQSAYRLAAQSDIVDLHIIDQPESGGYFLTIHTPTGRVMPPRQQKVYDPQFINDGLYAELMATFEKTDIAAVQVTFHRPAGYEDIKVFNDQARQEVTKFLASWPDYQFDVYYESDFFVYMRTSKKHVLAMKEDERVASISRAQFLY